MNKLTVCVDVDLTVVDTLSTWVSWWEKKTGAKFPWEDVSSNKSINKILKERSFSKVSGAKFDSLSYWNKRDLYDNLKPLEGSVDALRKLSRNHEIYFVTKCTKGHYRSKVNFLNKYFPFNSGVMNTENKHLFEADIYFEDHTAYVEKIVNTRKHSKVYQFMTKDNEHQEVDGAIPLRSWLDL